MPSEVAYLVDTDQPYPVIGLSGMLSAPDSREMRSTVLDVLATQPEGVVIDVEAVRLGDGTAPRVLAELARDTAAWPASRLMLSTTHGDDWTAAGITVRSDRAAALAALGDPWPGTRRQLLLDPVVGAARRARELVTEVCARWERPELCGPACIVVTEMVNNVVAHAKSAMTVLLGHIGDTISVAVRDNSTVIPRFAGPVAPTAYGGRGLLLIDAVSDSWGSLALRDGKVVWSLLSAATAGEPGDRRAAEAGIPDAARG